MKSKNDSVVSMENHSEDENRIVAERKEKLKKIKKKAMANRIQTNTNLLQEQKRLLMNTISWIELILKRKGYSFRWLEE